MISDAYARSSDLNVETVAADETVGRVLKELPESRSRFDSVSRDGTGSRFGPGATRATGARCGSKTGISSIVVSTSDGAYAAALVATVLRDIRSWLG